MERTLKRFFIEDTEKMGNTIFLTGPQHHHLAHVLRCSPNENVILVCGDEYDYRYKITEIQRNKTVLTFVSRSKNSCNPQSNFTVFLGLLKLSTLPPIIEQLNQIGATDLVLFVSGRTNIDKKHVSLDRLQNIANQSCKQCGRSTPMIIRPILEFDEMTQSLEKFNNVFYADRSEKKQRVWGNFGGFTALVIGPEGGFDLDENLAITKHATPITLGKRTLRSETAVVVASTMILERLGEL